MKAHGRGSSGKKKFALLVEYLAKGKVGVDIQLGDVQRRWSKMTSLLGNFNRKFTNDAEEDGWVDTRKKGVYMLTTSWKGALAAENG